MANKDKTQKSALGKGLSEVLSRQAEPEEGGNEEKDIKTQAQEFLLSVESRIKKASSAKDVDITDVEIEYLQARTAFAVGNFQGTLDYLEKIKKELKEVEDAAEEEKQAIPPPPEEKPPVPDDEEDTPPPPDEEPPAPPPEESEEPEPPEDEEEKRPEDKPMIFCMMCGEKITDDSAFCNWCGDKVE